MKSITGAAMVICLALGLGWLSAARAQQGAGSAPTHPAGGAGGPAMNADTPEDDAALNLTDEQKAQIKTIREDGKAQIAALGKDASLSADAEQQKQWAAEQRELRAHKHGGDAAADSRPQNY